MIRRWGWPLLLLCGLPACGPTPPDPVGEVRNVVGTARYQETDRQYTADLVVSDSTDRAPTFFGGAMERISARRYRSRRSVAFTAPVFGVGTADGWTDLAPAFAPPTADSIPPEMHRDTGSNFYAGPAALEASESLIVFFEPRRPASPHRILITGPTTSGRVSLPPSALAAVDTGAYTVYLVKQQLYRERRGTLRLSLQTEYFTRSVDVRLR